MHRRRRNHATEYGLKREAALWGLLGGCVLALAVGPASSGGAGLEAWIELDIQEDQLKIMPMARAADKSKVRYVLVVNSQRGSNHNRTRQSGTVTVADEGRSISTVQVGVGGDQKYTIELQVTDDNGSSVTAERTYVPDPD